MNGINIETLLNTVAPMTMPTNIAASSQTAAGNADGLFLSLLQSFAGATGGEGTAEDAQATATAPPNDWLATLLNLLAPSGTPNTLLPTPDSTGEASDGTGETVSLTDMMAAIQSLAGQAPDNPLTAEQVMRAFTESVGKSMPAAGQSAPAVLLSNKKLTDTMDAIVEELGMAQNPTILAVLTQLQQPTAPPTVADAGSETVAASGESVVNGSPPAMVIAQLTNAVNGTTPQNAPAAAAQPVAPTDTPVTPNDGGASASPAQPAPSPKFSTPSPSMPTPADAPAVVKPATNFVETLTTAQSNQTTAAPTTQAAVPVTPGVPVAETTDTPSGEKSVALPTDAPTVTAPQSPAAPPVSAPAVAEAPAASNLPNIPALHQIVDTMAVLKQNGQTAVRLHLHPESLGQVMIQLHMNNGGVTVQMLAETTKAQSLIQNHLPELKAAFSTQGLNTGALDVSVGSDASAFAAPRRQTFNWQSNPRRHTSSSPVEGLSHVQQMSQTPSNRHASGRIDYHI